jgi:hypothetical protein
MADPTQDVLIPVNLILPDMSGAKQDSNAPTGLIGMSGANVVFYSGSAWNYLSGNNTGD